MSTSKGEDSKKESPPQRRRSARIQRNRADESEDEIPDSESAPTRKPPAPNARKQAQQPKKKSTKSKDQPAADKDDDDRPHRKPPPPKKKAAMKGAIPPDRTVVGLDTGEKSLGVFRLEPHNRDKAYGNFPSNVQRWTAKENFSISMRHINERNGSGPRQRQLAKHVKAELASNPWFQKAMNDITEFSPKTADRSRYVTAIQKRGIHFRTLYTFYSKDQNARIKTKNYINSAREVARVAKLISPDPKDIVLVGCDWMSDRLLKTGSSFTARLFRYLCKTRDTRKVPEFRTSKLDSNKFQQDHFMYAPRQAKPDKKGDGVHIRPVYGLMQSSQYTEQGGCVRIVYSHLHNRDKNAGTE